jgi:hypothetical protein
VTKEFREFRVTLELRAQQALKVFRVSKEKQVRMALPFLIRFIQLVQL